MSVIIDLNDNNFASEVVDNQSMPVFVDFYADWCGPCRKLEPIVEKLASEYSGKIKFAKIKADENVSVAQKYSVIGVPCILIFKDGEPAERIVNVVSESAIKKIADKYNGGDSD